MAEWLEVEGTSLDTPAIRAEDLTGLRARMLRGANLTMNGAIGTRPYAPILDELEATVRWKLNGFREPDGTPYADPQQGLDENLELYRAAFMDGADATTGEKDFTLHLATEDLTAPIQVWSWDPVRSGPGTMIVVTRLVVAGGLLVPVP